MPFGRLGGSGYRLSRHVLSELSKRAGRYVQFSPAMGTNTRERCTVVV